MSPEYHRILLIFVDGIGLATGGPNNPLSVLPTPAVRDLLGGPLTLEQCRQQDGLLLAPLDATLGIEGLPQSATGQTALFTGVNGAARLGRHVTGLPGPRLRAIVEEGNLLQAARERGLEATFANAYTAEYLAALASGTRRPSVTSCAVLSSGLTPREIEELHRGEAVSWDIVRDRFAEHVNEDLPPVTSEEAGVHLAKLALQHHLTLYETFITDMAGHGRLGFTAEEALRRIDGLISGVIKMRDPRTTVLLASDHGNIEESRDRRHTRNPVPLLAVGPLASRFTDVRSILEVTPRILECLTQPLDESAPHLL